MFQQIAVLGWMNINNSFKVDNLNYLKLCVQQTLPLPPFKLSASILTICSVIALILGTLQLCCFAKEVYLEVEVHYKLLFFTLIVGYVYKSNELEGLLLDSGFVTNCASCLGSIFNLSIRQNNLSSQLYLKNSNSLVHP